MANMLELPAELRDIIRDYLMPPLEEIHDAHYHSMDIIDLYGQMRHMRLYYVPLRKFVRLVENACESAIFINVEPVLMRQEIAYLKQIDEF